MWVVLSCRICVCSVLSYGLILIHPHVHDSTYPRIHSYACLLQKFIHLYLLVCGWEIERMIVYDRWSMGMYVHSYTRAYVYVLVLVLCVCVRDCV